VPDDLDRIPVALVPRRNRHKRPILAAPHQVNNLTMPVEAVLFRIDELGERSSMHEPGWRAVDQSLRHLGSMPSSGVEPGEQVIDRWHGVHGRHPSLSYYVPSSRARVSVLSRHIG
jgi:hypothetical protein